MGAATRIFDTHELLKNNSAHLQPEDSRTASQVCGTWRQLILRSQRIAIARSRRPSHFHTDRLETNPDLEVADLSPRYVDSDRFTINPLLSFRRGECTAGQVRGMISHELLKNMAASTQWVAVPRITSLLLCFGGPDLSTTAEDDHRLYPAPVSMSKQSGIAIADLLKVACALENSQTRHCPRTSACEDPKSTIAGFSFLARAESRGEKRQRRNRR